MATTTTIKPSKYISFKKRALNGVLISTGFFSASELLIFLFANVEGKNILLLEVMPLLLIILIFLFIIGAIWELESISFNKINKTIHIRIRRFDKIIDKGEYTIDDKLKVRVSGGFSTYRGYAPPKLIITYKRWLKWIQFPGFYNLDNCWSYQLFKEIENTTNEIRQAPEVSFSYNNNELNNTDTTI